MENAVKSIVAFIFLGTLAGCVAYQPEPLGLKPSLKTAVPRLDIDTSKMPLPEFATHKFDPSDGLDMTEVAMLAVVNNPDLKLARDDLGIAQAQAFAAGLLPDPQISFSPQFPQNGGPGESTTAFDLGLSYNISALVMRASSITAAKAESRKTDLALLWQEWQVVGQARLLFVRNREQHNLLEILRESRDVAALRYKRERAALAEGNLTLTGVAFDANTLQGIDKQINEVERGIGQNEHALNALLGLAPDVKLRLAGESDLKELSQDAISRRLDKIATWRPDLLAFRAGYEAQDVRLRQAIMAQFPAINVGISRSRDNTGINYQGFSISLSLPIFNRNQGNIAIEKATRERMHDEFQVRLNTAYSDVTQLLADQALLQKQLGQVQETLVNLEHLVSIAEPIFRAGNMDLPAYSNLRNAVLSKKTEEIAIEQSMLEQRVALQTLLGSDLPEKISQEGKTP
ncbi:outer membrane efflux protein [mine drainage metagenome]|uniref:Outer membrane efflux protein n=1 Tax=mine drainage metagenome TaxID=410659 RepID=A0A1J5QTL8_9ZZZZ